MNTIAKSVESAYDELFAEQFYDEGSVDNESCYIAAIREAHAHDGEEIDNSNWSAGSNGQSFAPTVTFRFSDGSEATVTYNGVYV
jgi:hypothetical protein|nr:MAG TPA: hypothetical protein [Bacteriophage sp.]